MLATKPITLSLPVSSGQTCSENDDSVDITSVRESVGVRPRRLSSASTEALFLKIQVRQAQLVSVMQGSRVVSNRP
jgi:hypothetical protein